MGSEWRAAPQSGGRIPSAAPTDPVTANLVARNNLLTQGVERLQQVYSQATNPANQTIVNVQPQNVGLIRGLLVKVEGTIANTNTGTSGVALARTNFGAANMLRNIF